MTKLIVAFRKFANVRNDESPTVTHLQGTVDMRPRRRCLCRVDIFFVSCEKFSTTPNNQIGLETGVVGRHFCGCVYLVIEVSGMAAFSRHLFCPITVRIYNSYAL